MEILGLSRTCFDWFFKLLEVFGESVGGIFGRCFFIHSVRFRVYTVVEKYENHPKLTGTYRVKENNTYYRALRCLVFFGLPVVVGFG